MRHRAAAFLVLVALLNGCAEHTRYEVLSFFFDGVPPPGTGKINADTEKKKEEKTKIKTAWDELPKGSRHQPYSARQCKSCHEVLKAGGKPTAEGLCFRCHHSEDFKPAYEHDPVASGDCRTCHDAHQSPTEDHILLRAVPALCTECHQEDMAPSEDYHGDLPQGARCTDCHGPHGGPRPRFLRGEERVLCTRCHSSEFYSAPFVHAPVEAGQCGVCHEAHRARNEHYLIKPGDGVCLQCHEEAGLVGRGSHREGTAAGCMRCHEPHGSRSSALMLKAGAAGGAP